MKKKILLGISLTLAAFNSNATTKDNRLCNDFKISELLQEMKQSKEFFAKNPFDTNCVPFLLHTAEKPTLTVDDFNGSKMLYDEYNTILKNSGFEVITLYTPSTGQFYQFFKLDEETPSLISMKERWQKQGGKFATYFNDFIKLHEITHLDFEAVKDIRHDHNAMETIADVSAVILLSVSKEFTVKETIEFLQSVNNIRKNNQSKKVGQRNNLAGQFQDEQGYFANETNHFDRKIFSKVIKDLKSIKNQEQLMKMTDLLINTKEEDIVKFVRDRYKPK